MESPEEPAFDPSGLISPTPSHRSELDKSKEVKAYTDEEFALILSKAVELARTSENAERPASGWSLKEMKAIAGEVGLDPEMIERAARLVPATAQGSVMDRILGGPLRYRLDARFPTQLTEKGAGQLLARARAELGVPGEGEASATGVSLVSGIEGCQVFLTVHTEGEETRVRVTVDRRGALVGTTFLSGILGFVLVVIGGSVSNEFGVPAWLAVSLIGSGVAGLGALARIRWKAANRSIRGKLDALMDAVSRSLVGGGGSLPGPDRESEPR